MNRFSKQWCDDQERQMKKKLDLASRLEEVGVTIIEPEKMELENLQELHDKHFVIVQKNMVKKGRYLNYREIAEFAGVNYSTFFGRLYKGYSIEQALLGKPVHKEIPKPISVKLKKSEKDPRERKKRRMEILMQLNTQEATNGSPEKIARLERELANV
jgi:hypothetical protein